MFYHIKNQIITSNIKKRQSAGYDVTESECYSLSPEDDQHINNSYFFSAHTMAGETLFVRLGLRGDGSKEVWVGYSDGNCFVENEKELYSPDETAPLKVECIVPAKQWQITYDGTLRDVREQDRKTYHGTLNVEFQASAKIFDFFYDNDPTTTAHALASEKWSKQLFADISANNQRHYEQAGTLKGQLCIDNESRNLNMVCGRDHSFGPRYWSYMNRHFWILGIDENGCVLNISMVSYPCVDEIWTGYTTLFGQVDSIASIINHSNMDLAGHSDGHMKLDVTLTNGRCFSLETFRDDEAIYHFDNGSYYFSEGFGHMKVDDKIIRGTIEFSFNGDKSRWEGR